MTCTRHGNNLHPELPPCPTCGEWAWRLREPALTKSGYDDEMFTNTSR